MDQAQTDRKNIYFSAAAVKIEMIARTAIRAHAAIISGHIDHAFKGIDLIKNEIAALEALDDMRRIVQGYHNEGDEGE